METEAKINGESVSLLAPEDIAAMREHLECVPPTVGPPPGRPYWDVRRIVVTLEQQAARIQALETALKGITPPSRAAGCWCEYSRDVKRVGHSERCLAARKALEK